jgi:hypothetical protein
MPRKPNATRPNANTATAGAVAGVSSAATPRFPTPYATAISDAITSPNQYALKLPAVSPLSTVSAGPPSRLASTISRTCRLFTLVNALVNSGINAPASVPQLMMVDSFHHSPPPSW